MTSKEHPTDVDSVKTATFVRDGAHLDECIDWRHIAERHLTRLTEAEHDLSVIRDRLDYLRSNNRLLSQQSEERLVRIRELERELDELHTLRSRIFGFLGTWRAALRPRAKALILGMIGLALRVPLIRPAAGRLLRIFPKLGNRLRARVLASHREE